MDVFRINRNSKSECDFDIMTSLGEEQIRKIIQPMVDDERVNDILCENIEFIYALKEAYPKAYVILYFFNTISF